MGEADVHVSDSPQRALGGACCLGAAYEDAEKR